MKIYFWQEMLTPHMTGVANELSDIGYEVIYIYQVKLSQDRKRLGWEIEKNNKLKIVKINKKNQIKNLIDQEVSSTIHICQGFRGNGIISYVQKLLKKKKLRQWIIIETLRSKGILGFFRKILYKFIYYKTRNSIEVILAIGKKTPILLKDIGFNPNIIFPFAYFIKSKILNKKFILQKRNDSFFKFIYVGSLNKGKRVDLIIQSLSMIYSRNFNLTIIGEGPEKDFLKKYGDKVLSKKIQWLGVIKMTKVSDYIAKSDCLILPSDHDGWGTVLSEAIMAGVPTICSDACGASDVMKLSGYGKIFASEDAKDLLSCINFYLNKGPINQKEKTNLINWSKKISSYEGAKYLSEIINYINNKSKKPKPPWLVK